MEKNAKSEQEKWIWFKLINIDNNFKLELLKKYTIQQICNLSPNELKGLGLNNNQILEFTNKLNYAKAKSIYEYNLKNNIGIVNISSNAYPFFLKTIYNAPILLYYKGKKDLLNKKAISIFVGKDVDVYGKKVLKQITNNLLKDKICLVTKFEEYDNKIFLNNISNENILVLSSGIKENTYSKNGIVISENEPHVNSNRNELLKRNRIITGLTYESILIQMTINDGVIYIVDLLLEQNRELWVIPGDITKHQNFFTNELIRMRSKCFNKI